MRQTAQKAEQEQESLHAARAAVVNRTHRVVREEARRMREQRSRSRSLWVPLSFCSALLLLLCYAAWQIMAGYDLTPTAVPDAGDQILLLLLWSMPVTILVVGLIWFRRSRGQHENLGGSAQ